jgi:4-amino-4-deoxy-L-arabinose transferase-like glycosyltransferase
LLVTAVFYLRDLSSSGYADSFYSVAAQAGSRSWNAFFFGSLDAGNAIPVDKPPAALWPMALSARMSGLGSWQILLPQALMAVATAAVLYAAVLRRFSAAAGLLTVVVFGSPPGALHLGQPDQAADQPECQVQRLGPSPTESGPLLLRVADRE